MEIQVSDLQDKLALRREEIEKAVRAALQEIPSVGEISVVLMDDDEIARVNDQFLRRNRPTDVLSFDLSEDNGELSGEIMISTETAMREAQARGHSPEAEALFYIVHGILHLLGWDDDTPAKREAMLHEQAKILKEIGYEINDLGTAER